jgi:hypothetical protein
MRDVRVTKKLPEYGVVEIEQAQRALRVGLDRATKLVRQAKLEMGAPDCRGEAPAFRPARMV